MTTLTIPTDLARQLETDAYKLASLVGLIDVVHEAAQGADLSSDTIGRDAANGLPTLIALTADMAKRHAETVDRLFTK